MKGLRFGGLFALGNNNLNDYNNRNVNANRQPSNLLGMTLACFGALSDFMKTYSNLFSKLCGYDNLFLAFKKAKKGKSKKQYVIEFEKNLQNELFKLQWELLTHTYAPKPLTTFTVRDPKTRKISSSHFRDRVIHHAICNIINPIFESRFIYDTYANRKGKGTLAILKRFDFFLKKVSGNGRLVFRERERERVKNANNIVGYVLKADIRHYFETIDHEVLISILQMKIKDEELIWLICLILSNHKTKIHGKGMPLGNLTSQFFANVYLSELDNFAKHELKAKYYLRYVDDFLILHRNREQLEDWNEKIGGFLMEKLKIRLHPDKTKMIALRRGVPLVGFRVFCHYKLLKKSNLRKIERRLAGFREQFAKGGITHGHILCSLAGWEGYAKMGNTYKVRMRMRKEATDILRKKAGAAN